MSEANTDTPVEIDEAAQQQANQKQADQASEEDSEMEAAMLSAVNRVRKGIEDAPAPAVVKPNPGTAEDTSTVKADGDSPAPEGEPAAPAGEPKPDETVSMPKAEFDALRAAANAVPDLQKQLRDINGRFGNLNQQLQSLRDATTKPEAGKSVAVKLAKLRESGYEDLAELIEADLAAGGGAASIDDRIAEVTATATRAAQEAVAKEAFDRGVKHLRKTHPDFEKLRDAPTEGYRAWLGSLSETDRTAYLGSSDPYDVAEKLTEFRAWEKAQAKPAPSPAKDKAKRLEAAETPTGAAPRAPNAPASEEEVMQLHVRKRLAERRGIGGQVQT